VSAVATKAAYYGWPASAPGTPVFVKYFGCIFISGRNE